MKTIKKIACTLIAALLVLATGVTGLSRGFTASADGSYSITINNAKEGETYSAYKIFDVTVSESENEDGTPIAYSYKVDSDWTDFISSYKYCAAENGCTACEDCECCDDESCTCKQYEQCTCTCEECACCDGDGCCVNLFTLEGNETDGYLLSSTSAVFKIATDDSALIYFASAAKAYAEKNGFTASGSAKCEPEATSVTISALDAGWYLVTGTANSTICMLDTVTTEATIEDKIPTPTIDKSILTTDDTAVDEDTDANTDYVQYQIILSGIYGATNLVLHDALPDGLTLVNDENDTEHSITVTVYSESSTDGDGVVTPSGTSTAKTKGTDYTVTSGGTCSKNGDTSKPVSNCSFEIYFGTTGSPNTDMDLTTGLTDSAVIVITYWCTVDSTKRTYDSEVESLVNTAGASYGDSSWTTTDTAEVDTFEFKILKTDDSENPLEGAQFIIQNEDGYVATFDTDINDDGSAVYIFKGWMFVSGITDAEKFAVSGTTGSTKDSSETTQTSNTAGTNGSTLTATNKEGTTFTNNVWEPDYYLVSLSTGSIVVQGMDTGTYTLTEVVAPDGYNLLTSAVTVTIAYSGGSYTLTVNSGESVGVTASEHKINVVNKTGSILPGTGGIGTTIFYIVGGVIIIVAVVLLVTRRRVGAKDDK